MPANRAKVPGTIARSSPKAQRTYKKTLENAESEYGKGERASRTAYSALKHSYEKVDDHWEPKKKKGPSDSRAARGRGGGGESAGGVDVNGHSRAELIDRAKSLGIRGYSSMNKTELGQAIARKSR